MSPEPNPRSESTVQVTSAMEDYLKAAYRLEQEGQAITTQRLAESLALSQPSVTNMIKRLDDLNLVVHSRYHGIELTAAGRKVALEVIRHHRLLELYLSQALGFNLDAVHAEAERLEHHVSEELESRMEQALGFPEFDPHGDPIPGRDGTVPVVHDVELTSLHVGERGRVSRMSDRDADRLSHLCAIGVNLGTDVSVIDRSASTGDVTIQVERSTHVLTERSAASVRVVRSRRE